MQTHKKRRPMTAAELLIAAAAVFCGLVACAGMILHMKLFSAPQGDFRISLMERLQGFQPFLGEEAPLEPQTLDLIPAAEPAGIKDGMVDDGLDLDQIQEGQFSLLVLGTDESRTNTDVIMLVMLDLRAGEAHILQIPRDTFVPGFTSFAGCKLNSVYSLGNPNRAPVQRVAECLEALFRVPLERYVQLSCNEIAEIVDSLGGVPVDMPYAITYEAGKIIPAGEQVLSGEQAEWLLRFRHDYTEGDIGRLKAQRIFFAAAMARVRSLSSSERLRVIGTVMNKKLIRSDLSLDEIAKLGDFAASLAPEKITLHLLPGEGTNYHPPLGEEDEVYSVWTMHKQAVTDLLNQYFRPYFEPVSALPIAELIPPEQQYSAADDSGTDLQRIADGETFSGG